MNDLYGDGNATRHFGATLAYDHENQLTSSSQGGTVTYGYDGDGLRAWKQVGENARTYYLYDGETLLAELTPTGTLSAINTWGANGLVARWTTAGLTYYQYDNLGNVSDRLNDAQTVVSSDLYDAYGVRQIGSSTDPYGYKGQYGYYTDRETGLILCTYRYYDPTSGGWLTRDPIGYAGGANLYGYVGGNPVSGVDPSGLAPQLNLGLSGVGQALFWAWYGGGGISITVDQINPCDWSLSLYGYSGKGSGVGAGGMIGAEVTGNPFFGSDAPGTTTQRYLEIWGGWGNKAGGVSVTEPYVWSPPVHGLPAGWVPACGKGCMGFGLKKPSYGYGVGFVTGDVQVTQTRSTTPRAIWRVTKTRIRSIWCQ